MSNYKILLCYFMPRKAVFKMENCLEKNVKDHIFVFDHCRLLVNGCNSSDRNKVLTIQRNVEDTIY